MSKLEELIKEFCPNGVEYVPFYSICKYIRGITYNSTQEIFDIAEGIGVLRANNIDLQSNTLVLEDIKSVDKNVKIKEEQWLKKDDILICAGSGSKEHIGKIAYIFKDLDITFGGFMGVIRTNKNSLISRFLFHFLTSNMFKKHLSKVSTSNSSTINNINNETWRNLQIPVPALPVQREIVRILDSFTLYSAELTAELTARRKQYEYYRDKLLNFSETTVKKFVDIGWYDTLLPLTIPAFFGGGIMNIFMIMQFIRGIPKALDEAAKIDGANLFVRMFLVTFPLVMPIVLYIAVTAFFMAWNDLMGPLLYIQSEEFWTVNMFIYRRYLSTTNISRSQPNVQMGIGVVLMIPMLIVFMFYQNALIEGLSLGGVKG